MKIILLILACGVLFAQAGIPKADTIVDTVAIQNMILMRGRTALEQHFKKLEKELGQVDYSWQVFNSMIVVKPEIVDSLVTEIK